MAHHHAARIAREPAGRFPGNVAPLLQYGLAWLLRVRQDCGVHMDHHLVPLPRGAGIELVMQRRLREQAQRVRLLLGPAEGVGGRNDQARGFRRGRLRRVSADPLVECLARGGQRLHEQRAHFRLQAASQDDHAVFVLMDVQRSAGMPPRGFPRLGLSIHSPPAAHDPLHVRGRPRAPHPQQPGFGLGRGHAGQSADLGVGQLAEGQGLGQARQRSEGARDPHPLAGRARVQPHPPGEPGRAGAEARVPTAPGVEVPDQGEQPRGGGVQVRGQFGDLVAETVQRRGASRCGNHGGQIDRHGEPSFG